MVGIVATISSGFVLYASAVLGEGKSTFTSWPLYVERPGY